MHLYVSRNKDKRYFRIEIIFIPTGYVPTRFHSRCRYLYFFGAIKQNNYTLYNTTNVESSWYAFNFNYALPCNVINFALSRSGLFISFVENLCRVNHITRVYYVIMLFYQKLLVLCAPRSFPRIKTDLLSVVSNEKRIVESTSRARFHRPTADWPRAEVFNLFR